MTCLGGLRPAVLRTGDSNRNLSPCREPKRPEMGFAIPDPGFNPGVNRRIIKALIVLAELLEEGNDAADIGLGLAIGGYSTVLLHRAGAGGVGCHCERNIAKSV